MPRFGELMRAIRTGAGKTQAEVGRALGYDAPFVSRIENGSRTPPTMSRILLFIDYCAATEEAARALVEAAVRERRKVVLSVSRPGQVAVLAALARAWPEMSDGECDALLAAIEAIKEAR